MKVNWRELRHVVREVAGDHVVHRQYEVRFLKLPRAEISIVGDEGFIGDGYFSLLVKSRSTKWEQIRVAGFQVIWIAVGDELLCRTDDESVG